MGPNSKLPEQTAKEITLIKGSNGLGFNIKGGTDIPHIPGESGIFVVKIREIGAAAENGQLNEGDKILEVNGQSLQNVKHTEAVDIFLNAGRDVNLVIEPGAENRILTMKAEKGENKDSDSTDENSAENTNSIPYAWIYSAFLVAGFATYLAFKYMRHK